MKPSAVRTWAPPRPTCRVVCAAAGYGKTTALRAWYPAAGARWHRGLPGGAADPVDALAGAVLDEARAGAGQIVFDDLPRLPADTARALTEALARLTSTDLAGSVDVALASRWPLGAATTALPDTAQAVIGPAELSLPVDRVADLLADDYDVTDWTTGGYDAGARDLPERVHQATAGWPALVHLAAEMLRTGGVPHGDLLPVLAAPGGLIAGYLAEEVLAALPEPALRLLEHVGDLAPVDPDLCRALGHPSAAETVRLLARCGLLTTAGSPPPVPGGPPPSARIVPVVAEVVLRSRRTRTASNGAGVAARAAAWFDEHGPAVSAALAHRRCGQHASCARVIERHGEAMLAAGHAEAVGRLIAELPDPLRTPRLWLFLGDARRAGGDLDAAMRAYAAAAPGLPAGSAALVWRIGRLHYHRGDARAMLAALAETGPGPHPPADAAQVSAWTATGHLLAGDPQTALRHAREAVSLAEAGSPDPAGADFAPAAALAAAQVSVALCLGALGDDAGSDEHYRLAQPIAERISDVVLLTRIMNNRTYHLLQAARFTEALAAARTCARYAAAARQPELRDIATCNEADALAMLGRFDEAVRQYERAIAGYRRAGSRRVAGAQLGLGEVYRRRGWREQARAAFEQAVRISTETGDGHVRSPAEAGLALALMADDPDTAAAHATVAGSGDTPALLAQGWLALHRGDRPSAGELATLACETARAQGDRLGLADALELRGAVHAGGPAAEAGRARTALRECHAIWTEAGAAVEAARITVTISRLPGAGPDDRIHGLLAAQRMESAGAVAAESPPTGRPDTAPDGPAAEISVQALGRFEVRVDGEPVPPSRWQSRKARDLLRILVARRGRPVPREELCELLWPDDDPAKTGHRLSVLLSIVRGVLDPAKARAADHYLIADQASIALDVTRVRVDVEDFLSYVARAARLLDAGDRDEARELLVTIDRHHAADAFDDEPYASWSGSLREQTRTAYLSMLRMLAQVCGPATSADGYLLRLLERDPYDEPAHRSLVRRLVRAGRHGEARRAFDRYGQAMREIGVRPPDRSLLAPPASGPPQRGPQAATLNGKYR
ncbi:tetratricopeptide repeat protein [Actinoplanes sp. NPDC026623]|uniref:tetratricopeptide repeat protein n=1 Tax=Actinoplanes sp. NPDC026623 TaxID=3155610 RepID=UPI0033D463B1